MKEQDDKFFKSAIREIEMAKIRESCKKDMLNFLNEIEIKIKIEKPNNLEIENYFKINLKTDLNNNLHSKPIKRKIKYNIEDYDNYINKYWGLMAYIKSIKNDSVDQRFKNWFINYADYYVRQLFENNIDQNNPVLQKINERFRIKLKSSEYNMIL